MLKLDIIFIDIDGVLNYYGDENTIFTFDPKAHDWANWCPKRIANLNKICKETGARVVISSSWRKIHTDLDWWIDQFYLAEYHAGLDHHITVLGMTRNSSNGFRGREVQDYLNSLPYLPRYVILDDDHDFYPHQNFIHVDGRYGLIPEALSIPTDLIKEKSLGEIY